MKLTKSQKVWFGLLSIGVGALVVDQATSENTSVLSDAIESLTTMATGDSARPSQPNEPQSVIAARQFAAGLRALDIAHGRTRPVRDAFGTKPAEVQAPAVAASEVAIVTNDAAERFASKHRLRGILHTNGTSQAWVDERLIEIGQRLGEARLVSADGMTAVFEVNGVRVALSLPDATLPAPAKIASASE